MSRQHLPQPMAEFVMKDLVKKAGLRKTSPSPPPPPAPRSWATPSTRPPGGSWRSTASGATARRPGSSAGRTTGRTTCSSAWTRPTSATWAASAAAIRMERSTCCWTTPAARAGRLPIPGTPGTSTPPGGTWRRAAGAAPGAHGENGISGRSPESSPFGAFRAVSFPVRRGRPGQELSLLMGRRTSRRPRALRSKGQRG